MGRVDVGRMKVWNSGSSRMHSRRGPKAKNFGILFTLKKIFSEGRGQKITFDQNSPIFTENCPSF